MTDGDGGGEEGARQLVLDLALAPSHAADEFLVAPGNEVAHAAVMRWPDWPDPVLLLTGPAGSGKSHLTSIWAERAGARRPAGSSLRTVDVGDLAASALALEDCDRHRPDERTFFHLLEALRARRGTLLITAREPPTAWGLRTPDLLSRLRLAPAVTIAPPDPPLIRAVIVKLFADRQISIDEDVVTYAARHCEQSFEAVNRFVGAADAAALSRGRRITRPFAAAIMAQLNRDGGSDQGPT